MMNINFGQVTKSRSFVTHHDTLLRLD